jgi:hypothetical protein
MGVSAVVAAITAPALVTEDLPDGLDDWSRLLGTLGGRSVEIAALILSACLFALGALGPALLRRREPAQSHNARAELPHEEPERASEPSDDERLADRAEHQAAQLRGLCAEWEGRRVRRNDDEFITSALGQARIDEAVSGCVAQYHREYQVDTERLFARLVKHGVVDNTDISLVEEPRFPDDILGVAKRLRTGAKRLRLRDDALAAWLDVHAAVIDRLEAAMRSYAEQEETDAEEVTATNQEFRLTYGAVLTRVLHDAEVWMEHIGSFPLWSDPDLSEGTTPSQADRAARLYAWINRRIKNVAKHLRSAAGDPAHVEFDAAEVAVFKDFAHDFAGWLRSREIDAPPDTTSVFGEGYEQEQSRALVDGEITAQEYQRNVLPFTEHREWANKVRAEFHRDWRSKVARNVNWARQSGAMKPVDVMALFLWKNPHGDDLNELAEIIERIADRL